MVLEVRIAFSFGRVGGVSYWEGASEGLYGCFFLDLNSGYMGVFTM